MNKKGFTVVELIITFVIVMVLSMGLFSTVDSYREKQQEESYRKEIMSYKNEILKVIQDDIIKNEFDSIDKLDVNDEIGACRDYDQAVRINFKSLPGKDLCFKNDSVEGKSELLYGDIKYVAPTKFIKFKQDIIYQESGVLDTKIPMLKFIKKNDSSEMDFRDADELGTDIDIDIYFLKKVIHSINIILEHDQLKEDQNIDVTFSETKDLTEKNTTVPKSLIAKTDSGNKDEYTILLPTSIIFSSDEKDLSCIRYIEQYFKNNTNILKETFKIDENKFYGIDESGLITSFNYNYPRAKNREKQYVANVPAEVDGIQVNSINRYSFLPPHNLLINAGYENLEVVILNKYKYKVNLIKEIVNEVFPKLYPKLSIIIYEEDSEEKPANIMDFTPVYLDIEKYNENGGNLTFYDCLKMILGVEGKLSKLDLSQATNLEAVGAYGFYNSGLTEIDLGNRITTIGKHAFDGNEIDNLIIPDSVTEIGAQAFGDSKITNLTIGSGVTSISPIAFSSNPIKKLNIKRCTLDLCKQELFPNSIKDLTIENGEIGKKAFYKNPISSLTLGEGVTTIGESAFFGNQISDLTIPSSVTTIGESAFYNNQISSLTLKEGVTTIGDGAFFGNQISSLTIPNSVTTIEGAAFSGNQISGQLIIPDSVKTIGYSAFGANSISNLTIGSGVTTIGNGAFENQLDDTDNNTLTSIMIRRKKADFLANVDVDRNWYSAQNPSITYLPD